MHASSKDPSAMASFKLPSHCAYRDNYSLFLLFNLHNHRLTFKYNKYYCSLKVEIHFWMCTTHSTSHLFAIDSHLNSAGINVICWSDFCWRLQPLNDREPDLVLLTHALGCFLPDADGQALAGLKACHINQVQSL